MSKTIALLEYDSIPHGISAGDACAKHANLSLIRAGTVEPGRYLVLLTGELAEVQVAVAAAHALNLESLRGTVVLPNLDDSVSEAIARQGHMAPGEAIAAMESSSVASLIEASDVAVKESNARLIHIGLADGLGGKAFYVMAGTPADVERSLEKARTVLLRDDSLISQTVIPQLAEDYAAVIARGFGFVGNGGFSQEAERIAAS